MKFMSIILKTLLLPLLIVAGIILGGIGIAVYWFYWTFKEEKLYNTTYANTDPKFN